jgi:tryptophan synthase alpha subunit
VDTRRYAGGEAGAPFDPAAANTDHLLAVADGNIVRCWDVRTGVHLGDITEAASAVIIGTALAIGCCDGTIDIS